MIQQQYFALPPQDGHPMMVGKELAEAPCGCRVFVGMRVDTREMATSNAACGPEHDDLVVVLQQRMKDSLDDPLFGERQERPAVEVFDEMLMAIYEEFADAPA